MAIYIKAKVMKIIRLKFSTLKMAKKDLCSLVHTYTRNELSKYMRNVALNTHTYILYIHRAAV